MIIPVLEMEKTRTKKLNDTRKAVAELEIGKESP